MVTLNVNGKPRNLDVPDDMPLLWTLRNVLGMTGTKLPPERLACSSIRGALVSPTFATDYYQYRLTTHT